MKHNSEKSGRKERTMKRRKSLRVHLNEQSEKAGNHFSEHFLHRLSNVRQVRLWVLEWVLLVLLVFLLAVVQIIWYNQAHESLAYGEGGTYSEASLGAVNSLNPLYATTESERILARLLFANLVSPDASGNAKGDLAKSVTHDESAKVWTVQLRDGLQWSDGEPINADDIIFTIGLISDKSAKTVIPTDFSSTKLEKIDDLTVKFTLPVSYVDFMDSLEIPLVPEHILKDVKPALIFENEFSLKPISSGPFILNAMHKSESTEKYSQAIYVSRNPIYFKQNPKLERFILKVYPDRESIVDALKKGLVRGTAALSVVEDNEFKGTSVSRRSSLLNGGSFAFMNIETLYSEDMRRAIRVGVDMDYVRQGLDESRKLDYPILANQEEGLEFPELPKHDRDFAKKELERLGYSYDKNGNLKDKQGELVTLRVAARDKDVMGGVAQRFADELRKLGFQVSLNLVKDGVEIGKDFFASVIYPRDYDILLYEVDLGMSPDPFVYYSSTQLEAMNFSSYNNNVVDDVLLSLRSATSDNLRRAKFNSFLKYWTKEVPAIGIYRSSLDYYYINDSEIYSETLKMTDKTDRFEDISNWAVQRRHVEMTP